MNQSIKKQITGHPFLKWAGGKGQLIQQINNYLPDNISTIDTYIEPFIGSGAIMFWLLSAYDNIKHVVINDINSDLINIYRVIKKEPLDLISELERIDTNYKNLTSYDNQKELYLALREEYNERNSSSRSVRNAALFIFLNRTCFNGLYRVNSKKKFNVPFGKYKNPKICDRETILRDSELLQKVEILCGDYTATKEYVSEKTFFYFDPPYKPISETSNFNSYTKFDFDDNEQNRLKQFCDEISATGAKFMLSNSDPRSINPDNKFFDELYQEYNITRVDAKRNINSKSDKRGTIKELLITNYLKSSATTNSI